MLCQPLPSDERAKKNAENKSPVRVFEEDHCKMRLLGTIIVRGAGGKRIELYQGDVTSLGPDQGFDPLVVSAFPDDYVPTSTSLIGALHRKGLSVAKLAASKEIDLRSNFSRWLSHEFKPSHNELRFSRILCFEPLFRGDSPAVVGDINRRKSKPFEERP